MKSPLISALLALAISVTTPATARAVISDDDSKEMLTRLVKAYYESDADTFWEISSKFKERMFENKKDVRVWMESRVAEQETFIKVRGVTVVGQAKITSEKLGDIVFRFDGSINSPTRVVVVTAFVHRVIEFDENVAEEQRVIDQDAVLKIYVSIAEEKLHSFKSDELNFGYEFASSGSGAVASTGASQN